MTSPMTRAYFEQTTREIDFGVRALIDDDKLKHQKWWLTNHSCNCYTDFNWTNRERYNANLLSKRGLLQKSRHYASRSDFIAKIVTKKEKSQFLLLRKRFL
jgi:hypothetical protein